MEQSDLSKKMIKTIGILLLIIIAAGAAFYRSLDVLPFALGAVLGAAVSALKVILLERAIDKALKMETKAADNYIRLQHFLRLLLTGAVLMLAVFVPFINLWGAAAGIITFQIAVYLLKFTSKA
ncbi:MAG: ATP synthase subunit I [Christensenellales bacterium]|jgi:hypothetical protein